MTSPFEAPEPPRGDRTEPPDAQRIVTDVAPTATGTGAMPTVAAMTSGEQEKIGTGGNVKAAALLAGAAALANKVRQEAPKRVQEFREKRLAGRCVVLTEVDGREVAIGPYGDEVAARQAVATMTGTTRVVRLVSPNTTPLPGDGPTGATSLA